MSALSVLSIRQSCTAQFRALFSQQPMILRVREGEKYVACDDAQHVMAAGQMGVIPAHLSLVVENRLSSRRHFAAEAICISPPLLAEMAGKMTPAHSAFKSTRHDRAIAAFDRAVSALQDPHMPEGLREHAVREVLLWLCEDGIGFGQVLLPSLEAKIRSLLAKAPHRNWHANEVAKELAMGESTLRRKLTQAGTTFQTLLIDARMAQALALLQTTHMPVNRVAMEVGYESASRFSVRFRSRFGVKPSDIRGAETRMNFDRIGTTKERIGTA
jgi:AraC-like DNA-binding protein